MKKKKYYGPDIRLSDALFMHNYRKQLKLWNLRAGRSIAFTWYFQLGPLVLYLVDKKCRA